MKACFRIILSLITAAVCLGAYAEPGQTRFSVNLGALLSDKAIELSALLPRTHSERSVQQTKISLSTGAISVAEALVELQKFSELPMSVRGDVGNDIVVLHLHQVSFPEVLTYLAEVTGSRWKTEQNSLVLERSEQDERNQWLEDHLKPEFSLAPAVAKAMDDLKVLQQHSVNLHLDRFQTLAQLVSDLPRGHVEGMEPGQRVVFSTHPTKMQLQLPASGLAVLHQLVGQEIEFREQEIERMVKSAEGNIEVEQTINQKKRGLAQLRMGRAERALLILQRNANQSLSIKLNIYDRERVQMVSLPLSLNLQAAGQKTEPNVILGPKLEFSPRAKQWAARWRGQPPHQNGHVLPSWAGEEPLDLFVRELLITAAGDSSLIACIPDSAAHSIATWIGKEESAEAIWANMAQAEMTNWVTGGVRLAAPRNPSISRYERMNRQAAKELIETVNKTGYLSLADLGKFAASSSRGGFSTLFVQRAFGLTSPLTRSGIKEHSQNQHALAIFYGLGQTRRDEMIRRGSSSPLTSANQKEAADWLTYNDPVGPLYYPELADRTIISMNLDAATNQLLVSDGKSVTRLSYDPGSAEAERTIFLESGVPSSATVTIQCFQTPAIRVSENDDQFQNVRVLNIEELGMQRAMREHPSYAEVRNNLPEYRVFTPGISRRYLIKITYFNGCTLSRQLEEFSLAEGTRPVSFSELPEGLKKEIESAQEAAYRSITERFRSGPDYKNR